MPDDDDIKREAALRQRLVSLGIQVSPNEKLVGDPELLTLASVRRADNTMPVEGSKSAACSKCTQEVTIAPSSQAILAGRELRKHPTRILCTVCLLSAAAN
jgi:hypothetical protein